VGREGVGHVITEESVSGVVITGEASWRESSGSILLKRFHGVAFMEVL
jgi:hypothetical protein